LSGRPEANTFSLCSDIREATVEALESFIIEAKAVTYVSGKVPAPSASRTGAKDISYERGRFRYLDSHFGGTDFLGQEVVWQDEIPVWAMNYYGRILDAERFDGGRAGTVIKLALTALYQEKRFLGGFTYLHPLGEYLDQSVGDYRSFLGVERIRMGERVVYQLDYQGGLIKP
jgi:hypothetical protein